MSEEYPRSWNVETLKTNDDRYIVTAAGWEPTEACKSYEIGIRDTNSESRNFWLIQASWDDQSVRRAAFAIKTLLEAGMLPCGLQEIFP